jgi:hypothetical protein
MESLYFSPDLSFRGAVSVGKPQKNRENGCEMSL